MNGSSSQTHTPSSTQTTEAQTPHPLYYLPSHRLRGWGTIRGMTLDPYAHAQSVGAHARASTEAAVNFF